MSSMILVSEILLGAVLPSESATLAAVDMTRVWEFDSLFSSYA